MQTRERSNIIQFENRFQGTENLQEEDGKLITLAEKKLFKNASLVDILKDDFSLVDILVEKDKISKIAKPGEIAQSPGMEVHDLEENFVLPAFWNNYSRFDNPFDLKNAEADESFVQLLKEAGRMANFLAGNSVIFEPPCKEIALLENILDFDEADLDRLSDEVAKKNQTIFLHVGLSLEELGSVEKKFGKPLVNVLEDFGFLDRQWVLVGGNCLEKDDFQLLAQYGGIVVLCPAEDAIVGRRPLNIQMLKNLGLELALGSGQAMDVDMFEAMKLLISTQRALFENGDALSEADALLMATCGNATLMEGMNAHFLVMEKSPTLHESVNSYLVWEGSKYGPLVTVADGNILQFDGLIYNTNLGMTYFEVIEKLNEMKEKQK